jgi:hypothetical protein
MEIWIGNRVTGTIIGINRWKMDESGRGKACWMGKCWGQVMEKTVLGQPLHRPPYGEISENF